MIDVDHLVMCKWDSKGHGIYIQKVVFNLTVHLPADVYRNKPSSISNSRHLKMRKHMIAKLVLLLGILSVTLQSTQESRHGKPCIPKKRTCMHSPDDGFL